MKRIYLAIFLSLMMSSVFASYVKCYSQGKLIYRGYVDNIAFESDSRLFTFRDKHKRDVLIAADCIVLL